jgi:outer membrane protein TolC
VSCTAAGTAAQTPAGPLTLEQALEMAEVKSDTISAARAGVRRAEAEQIRARSGARPQLSASASYDRALASEFEGVFTGGFRPGCAPFTLNQSAPLDARVAEIERAIDCGAVAAGVFGGASGDGGGLEDLPFGRENSWRAGLAFTQTLYSGGRLAAQAGVAEAGRRSAELGLTRTRAQLLFEVTEAYYDAVLSDRLVAIAEASVAQADATFRQAQAAFAAGTQPEFDVLRARVARDSQAPAVIRQRVNRDVALLRLKQLLDLPPEVDLRLADTLADPSLPPAPAFAPRVAAVEAGLATQRAPSLPAPPAGPVDRTAVTEAAATVQLREASLRLAEAQRKPSVTFNSVYSRTAYPSGLLPAFDRTNWSFGASVSVPLMTGGRQRGDELAARAELDQAQAELRQIEKLAALDTRSAWAELVAARAAWEATAGIVEQASRAYQIASVRFSAGVSTQLELSDSRLLLQQAEVNRAQAARDLQVARARVALLPDLPLAAGAAPARAPQPAVPQAPAPPPPQPPAAGQFASVAR